MVHQELNQCLERNVIDNLFLGRYPTSSMGVVDESGMKKKASELFRKLGAPTVGDLLRLYPRAYEDWRDAVTWAGNSEEAAALAALCAGNILLTTGSHTLSVYAKVIEPERLFVRVLPTHQALDLCAAAGMVQSHVIAMQGPFSRDFNAALYDQLRIRTMVSKDSGQPGGVADKVLPALERGIDVVMIERPKEDKR